MDQIRHELSSEEEVWEWAVFWSEKVNSLLDELWFRALGRAGYEEIAANVFGATLTNRTKR